MQLETLKKCDVCRSHKIMRLDTRNNICRCLDCGYIFDNPRPTTQEIINFYSRPSQYGFWFEHARDLLCRRHLKMIEKYKKSGKLLDVGAGPAQFLNQAKAVFDVLGTEVSKTAIKLAKEKYDINLIEGEFENIDFKDSKFDVITIIHTLEHISSPSSTIRKCRFLLKDDGVLAIAVPNDVESLKARVRYFLSILKIGRWKDRGIFGFRKIALDSADSEIHLSHFNPAVLRTLLARQGFTVIEDAIDPSYLLRKYKRIFYDLLYFCCLIIKKITGKNYFSAIWMVAAPFQKPPVICPICKEGKNFKLIRGFNKSQANYFLYQCQRCQVQFWFSPGIFDGRQQKNVYSNKEWQLAKPKIYRGYHKLFLKRNKTFVKGVKILDLGCGAGEFILELRKRGCDVWGIDFDKGAIKIANERFGLKNVYPLSFKDFFQKNNFPKFDVITFFEVLEHLDDPLDFINNAKKLLKPQGKIVLSVPFRGRIFSNLNSWDFPPHHFTRWNEKSISKIFRDAGFFVSSINYIEKLRILSKSVAGIFNTGLLNKSLESAGSGEKSLFVPKIISYLGKLKYFVLGIIPGCFLWLISKIINHKNGIMYIELEKKTCSKKVFFLLSTLSLGGGERVASELSLNLPENIEKIIVLFKNEVSYPYKGKIIALNGFNPKTTLSKAYFSFLALSKLRRLVKQQQPDFVISFGHLPNLLNIFSGARSIVRIDNFYSFSCRGFGGTIYKFLVKLLFNRADIIMPVSKESANDLIKNFKIKKEKIKVIYNPLNIKEIETLAKEPLEKEYKDIFKNPVIINMGQLGKQKNQKDLIRAFGKIKEKMKDVKLVILGQGSKKSDLKKLSKDLGIENSVHLLGWQKNPFKFIASSKIFVLSSLWEGLPYVLLEAMACGIPVVSYDCKSGPREILAPKTDSASQTEDIEYAEFGVLVKPGDTKFLSKAAARIILNETLFQRLKEKSQKRALDFDVSNIIKEWDFLYE